MILITSRYPGGALLPVALKGQRPTVSLNLVGSFGSFGSFGSGGLMLALAFGMICALLAASKSGKGRLFDAAMVDDSSILMAGLFERCFLHIRVSVKNLEGMIKK